MTERNREMNDVEVPQPTAMSEPKDGIVVGWRFVWFDGRLWWASQYFGPAYDGSTVDEFDDVEASQCRLFEALTAADTAIEGGGEK